MTTSNKARLKISKVKATRLRLPVATPASPKPDPKTTVHFRSLLQEFDPDNSNIRLLREIRANVILRELQKAYQNVKDQHQLILNIIESLPSSVVITEGPEHKIILINQYAMQFLGADAIGKTWKKAARDYLNPTTYATLEALDATFQKSLPQTLPGFQYLYPDGTTRSWDVYFYPLFKEDKQVSGVLFYAVETTSLVKLRRDAELTLLQKQSLLLEVAEQRRIFNALVESISDGLFLVDKDSRIVFANQPIASLLGINPLEVVGQPFSRVLQQIGANIVQPQQVLSQIAAAMRQNDGPAITLEFSYRLPENEQNRDLRLSFFDAMDAESSLVGQGCLISDITRQKELDRLKSQFISTVSHEMRTPLTGIYGYLELLLHRQPDEALRSEWLDKIHHEVLNLNQLLDELLDLSRIEAGRLQIHKEPVQLEKLIVEALADIKQLAHAETTANCHQFELEIANDLPAVNADRNKMARVFSNLLQNAVKYSPEGSLIQVKLQKTDTPEIMFSVRDEGMGIALEEQADIFKRFYRTRESQQRKIRGNGLGLSIVKAIVELHQGRVWLESVPQQGSTFYFTLPIN